MINHTLTVTVDEATRAALAVEAAVADLPAEQLVGDLIRTFIEERREARVHEDWFRREVEAGIAEANDSAVPRIDDAEVRADWQRERAELFTRMEMSAR